MFPDSFLQESHQAFRETCRRFASDRIRPHIDAWEETGTFPRHLYQDAAQAGILGVGFPEEFGGSGGDILHSMVGAEALHEGTSGGLVASLGSLGIALPPLFFLGTESQKKQFASAAFSGEKVWALAVTEPGAGSDVAGIRTWARKNGSGYILNGRKMFITSGCRADYLMVLCRTGDDPHGGLTFFIVPTDLPGVHRSSPLRKTGWWSSDTAEISFDDVEVPDDLRVGSEGSGFLAVMQNFQQERLVLAVYGHATAAVAYREALAYAKEREAFGKKLMGMQVIRHKLAHMATQVTVAQTMNYALGRELASGAYRVKEVSMAKNFSAEVAVNVTYEAVQIFGGMGYMRESVVERLSRDARLLPIGGGTQEIMNEIISKQLG